MPLPAGFCGPVRRLAQAAQRMSSGGDLSVRIHAQGRDELARLVTSFNTMAAALEDKVGELQRMEARARQFAGDVFHELRTPLTAMTAVAEMLGEHPGLTGDTAAAARLDESGQRNNDARHHPCRRDRN
jgi:two-component system sensor histidine kinase MtrB